MQVKTKPLQCREWASDGLLRLSPPSRDGPRAFGSPPLAELFRAGDHPEARRHERELRRREGREARVRDEYGGAESGAGRARRRVAGADLREAGPGRGSKGGQGEVTAGLEEDTHSC